ncbi:divergent polysaccharide deacetylase family protein [Shewanella sp. NFH-SH190041]|uniref:divergent polysaccharide deacetylase family protein n=1 Tax=Shewanella sp. NFH-SH190041 TaxID=2950245 RepID=UPI0021C30A9D|nr:divergent polysaccharide deacetylase family protein [Shewanella sp. NFH-SH190041]
MRYFLLLGCFLCSIAPAFGAKLAIIIDDLGYRQTDQQVISLPAGITLSILPYTPFAKRLATQGHQRGHEIMAHLPMQSLHGNRLGPGGLTNRMGEQEFKRQVTDALNTIPYVSGVNNHMGSLLTQLNRPMGWVMETLKQHNLYFVDSITTRYSKAAEQADHIGVPLLKRQIFLDNDLAPAALEKQYQQIIDKSQQLGSLIAIAHPHPDTLSFLRKKLPQLQQQGIELVPASQLLPYKLASKQDVKTPQARL